MFRIVGDEGAELVDNTTVMAVSAADNLRVGHTLTERGENICEGCVVELFLEESELGSIVFSACRCEDLNNT